MKNLIRHARYGAACTLINAFLTSMQVILQFEFRDYFFGLLICFLAGGLSSLILTRVEDGLGRNLLVPILYALTYGVLTLGYSAAIGVLNNPGFMRAYIANSPLTFLFLYFYGLIAIYVNGFLWRKVSGLDRHHKPTV